MLQDRAGYIVACTEHGVFAYDGRRFTNLGPTQGLPEGGFVSGLALTSSGRLAVDFGDQILVADRPSDTAHPLQSLSFSSVRHAWIFVDSSKPHRLAPWRDSFVLLTAGAPVRIAVPTETAPHVDDMGYGRGERALLKGSRAIFSIRGHLWEATADGRLCAADPGAVRCYGEADGLPNKSWMDVIDADDGGGLLARSASSVASFDPYARRWRVVDLPDQGGHYENYVNALGLFRAPDGTVITQGDHGLVVLGPQGWQVLSVAEGAPPGTIVSAMTDASGQFWLKAFGQGLRRWISYKPLELFDKEEGLSAGLPWQSVRLADGTMWVATDTAIDEI